MLWELPVCHHFFQEILWKPLMYRPFIACLCLKPTLRVMAIYSPPSLCVVRCVKTNLLPDHVTVYLPHPRGLGPRGRGPPLITEAQGKIPAPFTHGSVSNRICQPQMKLLLTHPCWKLLYPPRPTLVACRSFPRQARDRDKSGQSGPESKEAAERGASHKGPSDASSWGHASHRGPQRP